LVPNGSQRDGNPNLSLEQDAPTKASERGSGDSAAADPNGGQEWSSINRVIVPGKGPLCPRCGWPTQIREHRDISERELRKPYYFRRWFRCINGRCKTTLIMPDEFKVRNGRDDERREVGSVMPAR
jgi:hypothetical protein